jgi:hypothetical protein
VTALEGKNCNCPAGSRNQVTLRILCVIIIIIIIVIIDVSCHRPFLPVLLLKPER